MTDPNPVDPVEVLARVIFEAQRRFAERVDGGQMTVGCFDLHSERQNEARASLARIAPVIVAEAVGKRDKLVMTAEDILRIPIYGPVTLNDFLTDGVEASDVFAIFPNYAGAKLDSSDYLDARVFIAERIADAIRALAEKEGG